MNVEPAVKQLIMSQSKQKHPIVVISTTCAFSAGSQQGVCFCWREEIQLLTLSRSCATRDISSGKPLSEHPVGSIAMGAETRGVTRPLFPVHLGVEPVALPGLGLRCAVEEVDEAVRRRDSEPCCAECSAIVSQAGNYPSSTTAEIITAKAPSHI
ncbi:hypothetical protein AAFF_G00003210 [Aldrovandia affinis]|uniref:Uncharacterized protein n=1 Tax=Aldrovandia affinis TaxID=143900 RepID=A0AAD7TDV5_9TELE|nr:hypothetical protein AAFF_G00003210 [Aldrovandia affinis]